MVETYPEVMTIQETSDYLRIPVSSLYRLAQSRKIPCQKVGRHWRFRRQAIDRWLEEAPARNQAELLSEHKEEPIN